MQIEQSIISNLIENQEYYATVIPHLKKEYFPTVAYQHVFSMIKNHGDEYKRRATAEVLKVGLESLTGINDHDYGEIQHIISTLDPHPSHDLRWLIDETEKYCIEQSTFNALSEALAIQENAAKPFDQQNKRITIIE